MEWNQVIWFLNLYHEQAHAVEIVFSDDLTCYKKNSNGRLAGCYCKLWSNMCWRNCFKSIKNKSSKIGTTRNNMLKVWWRFWCWRIRNSKVVYTKNTFRIEKAFYTQFLHICRLPRMLYTDGGMKTSDLSQVSIFRFTYTWIQTCSGFGAKKILNNQVVYFYLPDDGTNLGIT